jgi:beta-galactosidase
VQYKLTNSGDTPLAVKLEAEIDGKSERAMDRKAILAPHSEMLLEAGTQLPKRRVKLWDFDHPNLYRLTTRLISGDIVQHEQSDRFGIRKIEITKESLLLNGERVRLVGFNRVSDSCATGNTEPRSLIVTDVDLMKRCGANMSRIMHTPQAPNMLDYLDEKGMLIIEEIPIPAEADISNHPENPLTRQWIREMIERDYNHPCIIGWSVCNECYMVYEYVRQMIAYMRENLDSHRLLTYVTNSAAGAKMNPTNEALEFVDLICHNMYFYYKQDVATVVHEKWPDKPIFFSELGIRQFGSKPDSTIPDLDKLWARIQKPYVVGGSLWTFNDYRSDYVGTPPTGIREWGVVDEQRRPKAAYYQVRRLFSPVREFTVFGGKVLIQPRSPDEIPSYTLRGYKIRWTLRDAGGSVKEHGEIPLPELKPGSPAWSTPLTARGPGLTVALIAPTGYDMVEWNSEESSLQ